MVLQKICVYGATIAASAAALYLHGHALSDETSSHASAQTVVAQSITVGNYSTQNVSYKQQSASNHLKEAAPVANLQEVPTTLYSVSVQPLQQPWSGTIELADDWTRVLTMNNFDSDYLHGGIIPPGGAEITVVAEVHPKNYVSLDRLVADYVKGDAASKITSGTVGTCGAKRVETETDFKPSTLVYKRSAVFVPVQHKDSIQMYKFAIAYNANENDLTSKAFEEVFWRVVKSAKLASGAKCGLPSPGGTW